MTIQHCLEDLREGEDLESREWRTSRLHLLEYAASSRDFNLIHHDPDLARAAGLADVIVQGTLKAARIASFVEDLCGEGGDLVSLEVQYRGMDGPEDILTTRGRITSIKASARIVELDVWLETETGIRSTRATATVRLPSRLTQSPMVS